MGRVLLAGATVWAGPACVPSRAWMLVEDGQVAALGGQEPLPPADRVVDLPGCHLLPGFVDVHVHLSQAAWIPRGGDGWGWRGLAEALRAVRVAGNASPQAPWLLFWNVARWSWPEGRLPTSGELDEAAPGRRVLVSSSDLHRGSVSSAGLEAIGSAEGDLAKVFGEDIARDRRGRPTGELWEAAFGVALQRALTDTAAHFQDAGTAAVYAAEAGRYLAHGITHAHDPYLAPDCHVQMAALRAAGPLRVSWATGAPDGILSRPPGPENAPEGPYGDAGREVKVFADGADRCAVTLPLRALFGLLGGAVSESRRLGGLGPLRESVRRKTIVRPWQMHTPYLRYTDTDLADVMTAYADAEIRLRIHAFGNRAGAQAARVIRRAGLPAGAATIDHLVLLDAATAELVAASGAGVSYQPGFLQPYGQMLRQVHVDRYATVLGGRMLLDAGIPLAISSDHPSGPLDPLHNLRAAVDRRLPDGRTLQSGQAITQQDAVRAYTVAAASSLGAPAGGLAAGEPADFVVCDGDPFAPATRVTQTWIAGEQAWPATAGGQPS